MELDAKERIQRPNRARPRRQLENQVFSGSTTRRGELWKCKASQVSAMGPLEVQGLCYAKP